MQSVQSADNIINRTSGNCMVSPELFEAIKDVVFGECLEKDVPESELVERVMRSPINYEGRLRLISPALRPGVRKAVNEGREWARKQRERFDAAVHVFLSGRNLFSNPWIMINGTLVRISDAMVKRAAKKAKDLIWEAACRAAENGQNLFMNLEITVCGQVVVTLEKKMAAAAMFETGKALPNDVMWPAAVQAALGGQDLEKKPVIEINGKGYAVSEKMVQAAMAEAKKKTRIADSQSYFDERPRHGVGSGLSRFSSGSKTAKSARLDNKAARRQADKNRTEVQKKRGKK